MVATRLNPILFVSSYFVVSFDAVFTFESIDRSKAFIARAPELFVHTSPALINATGAVGMFVCSLSNVLLVSD